MTPQGYDKSACWQHDRVTTDLHVHRYGPPGPVRVLALHGLTGHGQRWRFLSTQYLAEIALAAPDLIGHGRSSWSAPWTFDANVAALATLVENEADGPVLVVGHSFGGAVGLNFAAACPDLVSGLVLLDPAIGLDGQWMREIADSMMASPDYTDRDEARAEKFSGVWADVPMEQLDEDLDAHLMALPNGRYGWRICIPAMMSYWSELARDIVLPRQGTPTTLVRALWTDPPYISAELLDGLAERLGDDFTLVDLECQHMVANAKPAQTAAIIQGMLRRA